MLLLAPALQTTPFFREMVFRGTILSLRQWQFKWAPPPVEAVLRTVFEGWGQTAVNENGFNVIKDHCRDTKHGKLPKVQRYMLPHVEGVMHQFEREEIQARPADRAGNSRHLRKGCFDALGGQPSIDDKLLRRTMVSHPDWPRYGPQSVHMIPAAFSLLLHLHSTERWGDAAEAWKAVFAIKGTLLKDKADSKYFIVLDCCQFALLLWPCEFVVQKGTTIFKPMAGQDADTCWRYVFDFSGWEGVPIKPMSPMQARCAG